MRGLSSDEHVALFATMGTRIFTDGRATKLGAVCVTGGTFLIAELMTLHTDPLERVQARVLTLSARPAYSIHA